MKILELEPIFVEYVPKDLEESKLYISLRFKIAIHLCACGCKRKAVTPLDLETGWVLTENKNKVSLTPSIGNWMGEEPYHAHYFITDNKVIFV